MTTKPTMPAPLNTTAPVSREIYRRWQSDMQDYYAALQEQERAAVKRLESKNGANNGPISDKDYDQLVMDRFQAQQEAAAKAAAAEASEAAAKAAWLSSSPDVAEISERSEWNFLQTVCHFARKGYTIKNVDSLNTFPGLFYTVAMQKPESKQAAA